MKSLVILISGRGSNMQALIEARLPVKIAAVISSNPEAGGLEIARMHSIETRVVDQKAIQTAQHSILRWQKKLIPFNLTWWRLPDSCAFLATSLLSITMAG